MAEHKLPAWQQHLINTILTAFLLGAGAFIYDFVTVDPEHAVSQRRIDVLEGLAAQNTISNNQSATTVTELGLDRALPSLKGALSLQVDLKANYESDDISTWSEEDQELFRAAEVVAASARARLATQ